MSIVSDIRTRLSNEHPEIFKQVNGERIMLSDVERETLLDTWAESLIRESMATIRVRRDTLLAASDWTQVPDAPVNAEAWAAYRQALRDLPATITDPTAEVAWPEPPK